MATITIPDPTYRRLQAASAARGLSVDKFLEEVAAHESVSPSDSEKQLAALESFADGMVAWTSKHLPPGHVVDDSRDTIYEGRGG
jgi:hypothetical protein